MNDIATNKGSNKTEDYVWNTLKHSMYPGAKDDSIKMVLDYCKAFQIDPMQKAVHILPMSVKNPQTNKYEKRDTIIPGIALYRIQASRTNQFVGLSEPEYGETITRTVGNTKISYPEWCKITVKRLVQGIICEFISKEYWIENYAKVPPTISPNTMWAKRPFGQLAKCTEAQALRKAFPELLGQQSTFEELEGKTEEKEVTESKAKTMNEKLNEKFNLLPPIEDPVETKDLLKELTWLIDKHDISEDLIGKWCDKAEVENIEELDQDKIQSCIDYINTKNHLMEN